MKRENTNIEVVIVEDEAHNSRMLKGMIEKIRPDWEITAILESVEESVLWFQENFAPSLILMDIQLSDGLSFSIFEQVKIDNACKIIFTTAYDEYAIRAFKVNSIDYLLKPIDENDLEHAFLKFEQLTSIEPKESQVGDSQNYEQLIASILHGKKEYRKRFLIAGINTFQKLEVKDIAYIYSDNKITFAVDFGMKGHMLDYNLEQLEAELNPEQFFRANRKIIINIDTIEKVSNEAGSKLKVTISPSPEFDIIVSRLKATEFKIWMGK